tara:strand:- start:3063 stop:3260 length:198 start_codon:yes stop_codon:yes gene_type:complete
MTDTTLNKAQKSVQRMVERLTLTELLVSSMEMIENLPEDQKDPAWEAIFLLIEGAKQSGVLVAEA